MLNKKRMNSNKIKKNKSFLLRLFDILSDNTYNKIIHWNNEGTGFIIIDSDKLANMILPNFYIHNKYSSFVRQLNIYGFHKMKSTISEDGEGFYHDKINKFTPKDQIKQITRKNKKKVINYLLSNNKYNNTSNDNKILNKLNNNNEKDILNYLLFKNKESKDNLNNLNKELQDLRNLNKDLKDEFNKIKTDLNGQAIIIKRIIPYLAKNKTFNNQENKKVNTIKELFNQYLYFLRIYSPYILKKS